jgi:hypothetical protein
VSATDYDAEGKGIKKKTRSKKRRRGRPRDERVDHVIEFVDWEWNYMFGIDTTKGLLAGPYIDFRHLNIKGKILRPTSIKAPIADVTCFPDYRLSESDSRQKHEPKAVGYISHRGKDYRASLHLPADAFGLVLQMMIAGKYRYLSIEAEKSFRGEAMVRHFRFTGSLDEDDLAEA